MRGSACVTKGYKLMLHKSTASKMGRTLQGLLFAVESEFLTGLRPHLPIIDKYLEFPLCAFTCFFLVCISGDKSSDNYLNNRTICQRHLAILFSSFNEVGVILGKFYI